MEDSRHASIIHRMVSGERARPLMASSSGHRDGRVASSGVQTVQNVERVRRR